MPSEHSEPLRPKLERARQTLAEALDRACSADIRDADTGELIKIEEVLAIANEAAKEAISVRRRLGRDKQSPGEDHPGRREFTDAHGVRWSAFAVFPSAATAGRATLRESYQHGWLAFD